MPLRWLPEDDSHPVRPDLPVFRHLTFTEVHAIELGAYVGVLGFFALGIGAAGEFFTLLVAIVRFTLSDGKAKESGSKMTHRMGFHDVRAEPPYFGAGVLMAFVLAVLGAEVWMWLDTAQVLSIAGG